MILTTGLLEDNAVIGGGDDEAFGADVWYIGWRARRG